MNLRPKWQFYKTTQPPVTKFSCMTANAFTSCPSPIETAFKGYFFFFFANSSTEEVGSDPGDNKNKIGSKQLELSQILSMGYESGLVNSFPKTCNIKPDELTKVLSSLKLLVRQIYKRLPISFSAKILS